MNFCENGAGEPEQNGVSLEKIRDTTTVCFEEAMKEEGEKREEMMMKEEKEEEKEEEETEEIVNRDMVREDSDSEEKTERCALIRRSQSNSPEEGPERLV